MKGHAYWMVARAFRTEDRPQEERRLYLGRLDDLPPVLLAQKRQQVRTLGDSSLSLQFDALLAKLGTQSLRHRFGTSISPPSAPTDPISPSSIWGMNWRSSPSSKRAAPRAEARTRAR